MKSFKALAMNFDKPVIGKITKNRYSLSKDSVLLSENIPGLKTKHNAVITTQKELLSKQIKYKNIIYNFKNITNLYEGDIVLIEPSGVIIVLFAINSFANEIIITQECNCSCIMCPQVNEEEKFYFHQMNLKLINLIDKKTKYLGFTGGEPTTQRESIIELIETSKKVLPNTSVELLTNGILLSDIEYVKEIYSIQHHNLVFEIPIYSDVDTIHNKIIGADGFYKTHQALYNLARFQQLIEIRIVIHALNYERMPYLAEYIYKNFPFVYHIAFMGLELEGRAKENIDKLWIDPVEYAPELKEALRILSRAGMNVSIYNHQLCTIPESLWKYCSKSISPWKNIFLDECNNCKTMNQCGGFFKSAFIKHSSYIKPVI